GRGLRGVGVGGREAGGEGDRNGGDEPPWNAPALRTGPATAGFAAGDEAQKGEPQRVTDGVEAAGGHPGCRARPKQQCDLRACPQRTQNDRRQQNGGAQAAAPAEEKPQRESAKRDCRQPVAPIGRGKEIASWHGPRLLRYEKRETLPRIGRGGESGTARQPRRGAQSPTVRDPTRWSRSLLTALPCLCDIEHRGSAALTAHLRRAIPP